MSHCSDCGVQLVDEPPAGLRRPDDTDDPTFRPEDVPELVEVYRTDRLDAEVVRSLLEGNGIQAVVSREGFSSAYPLTVGDLGAGRVLVPREEMEAARELIESASEGALELPDADLVDPSSKAHPRTIPVGKRPMDDLADPGVRAWDRVPLVAKGLILVAFILWLLLGQPLAF